MDFELSPAQQQAQAAFRAFVDRQVAPHADEHDRQQAIPEALIKDVAARGYLGGLVPAQYGGAGMDALTWGLLCEEIARGSASLLSLFTVHSMVVQALIKWGTDAQRQKWLPRLATGELIGAFGLTEPNVGSDAGHGETTAVQDGGDWVLNGQKCWSSFGQIATLMLMTAHVDGKSTTFLVERKSGVNDGFTSEPIEGMLGFRSAMLADVHMRNCRVPADQMIGKIGFGFSHVIGAALDQGRYSIAWGCVGLAQAGLDASLVYSSERKQFGVFLKEHQLIQQMLTDMITETRAARLLCLRAAVLKQQGDPSVIMETSIAKYFASRAAVRIASDAVQIHGANGCSDRYPVQRYLRDAKIMEIIEGSSQMQQIVISKFGYQDYLKRLNAQREQSTALDKEPSA